MSNPLRQRGRPRTFDREVALDAAVSLFWRHGYEGTSIADLTAAMGVTPPTLYAAFGSKEELFREVLAHYFARKAGHARIEGFRREPSAYRAIETFLRDIAREFADPATPPGCMVSTSVLHCAAENQAVAQAVASFRATMIGMMATKFDEAKRGGQLRDDANPAALAQFYGAVIQGMSAQACDGVDAATLDGLVDVALGAWPGLRPRS